MLENDPFRAPKMHRFWAVVSAEDWGESGWGQVGPPPPITGFGGGNGDYPAPLQPFPPVPFFFSVRHQHQGKGG